MALALGLIGLGSLGVASYGQANAHYEDMRDRQADNAKSRADSIRTRPPRPQPVSFYRHRPLLTRGGLELVDSFPYYGGDVMSVYENPHSGQRVFQTSTKTGPYFGHGEAVA